MNRGSRWCGLLGSQRSDRDEGDIDKRSVHRRRDIGQYAPGSPGVGKTHLAIALAGRRSSGYSVQFSTPCRLSQASPRRTARSVSGHFRMSFDTPSQAA